jgi:uncharacterized protein (DUF3084 family)
MAIQEQKIEDKSALETSLEKEVAEEKKQERVIEKRVEKPTRETETVTQEKEAAKTEQMPAPKVGASAQVRLNDLHKMSRQNQVKRLCQLAFEQGLDEAIKTAKDLDNAYVLDEFHDTLVDELYKRLVSENKLKKF